MAHSRFEGYLYGLIYVRIYTGSHSGKYSWDEINPVRLSGYEEKTNKYVRVDGQRIKRIIGSNEYVVGTWECSGIYLYGNFNF